MKRTLKGLFVLLATITSMLMFSVIVSAAPSQVTSLVQTDARETSVDVKWDAVLGNNIYYEYEVSASTNFNGDKISGTTYSTSKYISGLAVGKTYYVRVRAVSEDYSTDIIEYGEWSMPLDVVTSTSEPTGIVQTAATTTTATIKWNAVSGATSYLVYCGSTKLGETKTASFTMKSEPNDSVYVYAMKKASTYSAKSDYGIIYRSSIALVPKKMKAPYASIYWSSLKEIKVEWDAVAHADGYQVQYMDYNKKSGNTTTTTLDYGYLKAKSTKFLKIRVRAYSVVNNQKKYGEWSSYNYLCNEIAPKLKKIGSTKLKINWSKVKGAKNYTVYVSTNGKSYKKVTTTKKLNYTLKKFKKKKLKKNKTYYVRIVANRKVGKKTYKSGATSGWYLK